MEDMRWYLMSSSNEIIGSSLVAGHVPTHPFPEAIPDPNLTLTQTGSSLVTSHVPTHPSLKLSLTLT